MIRSILLIIAGVIALGCNSGDKTKDKNKIYLSKDKLNIAKLTDTLVINENTCRGCAYEYSTHFDIDDSLKIIKLDKIVTTDNNRSDVAGGTVNKDLFLVPVKLGSTKVKLYKYYNQKATAGDSSHYSVYSIEIKN